MHFQARRQQGENNCVQFRGRLARRILGERGEAETPTSHQLPCVAQGRRLLGPVALCTCPFASLLSQVRARLGPRGLLSAFWERESPDFPACGLWRGSSVAWHGPSSSTQVQDPREGPSLVGRTMQGLLRGGLTRQAREEAERSRRGVPHEVLMTQAMTIKSRRAPSCAVSSFPI